MHSWAGFVVLLVIIWAVMSALLRDGGGRWRTGEWKPWVPTYVRTILDLPLLVPFIAVNILIVLPFLTLVLIFVFLPVALFDAVTRRRRRKTGHEWR
jgi:hypothetical protein